MEDGHYNVFCYNTLDSDDYFYFELPKCRGAWIQDGHENSEGKNGL